MGMRHLRWGVMERSDPCKTAKDWDITTSAKPEEIKAVPQDD